MKSQKNILFDMLNESGFAINDFKFEDARGRDDERVTRLVHIPSNYYFTFDFQNRGHFNIFSPGNEKIQDLELSGSWPRTMIIFNSWIGFLKRETEAPDKWEQFFEEIKQFGDREEKEDKQKFSYKEVIEIETAILQIKEGVKSYDLSLDQVEAINEKLDYLVDRSKILDRRDWRNLAIAIFTNIATSLAARSVPEDIINSFITLVKTSFKLILLLAS